MAIGIMMAEMVRRREVVAKRPERVFAAIHPRIIGDRRRAPRRSWS